MQAASRSWSIRALAIALPCMGVAPSTIARPPQESARVAMLRYGLEDKSSVCFSGSFLALAAMETSAAISQEIDEVSLASDNLFAHPLAVMTGEGAFELSDAEVARLRSYILQGGFLLASAGCSSDAWAVSMRRAFARAFPEGELIELPLEHEVFHTLFDIHEFVSRRRARVALMGLVIDGRLSAVFSAQGLNHSGSAGVDDKGASCCCCTGDEIIGAKYLNANIVVYAMTR